MMIFKSGFSPHYYPDLFTVMLLGLLSSALIFAEGRECPSKKSDNRALFGVPQRGFRDAGLSKSEDS